MKNNVWLIYRRIGNFAALHFASELCLLPLLSKSQPSYSEDELYKLLTDITLYVFSDADPTKSWTRRRNANKAAEELVAKMEQVVQHVTPIKSNTACPVGDALTSPLTPSTANATGPYQSKSRLGRAVFGRKGTEAPSNATEVTSPPQTPGKTGYQPKTIIGRAIFGSSDDGYFASNTLRVGGNTMAGRLLGSGKSVREVAQILVGTASAFVANTACAVCLTFPACISE